MGSKAVKFESAPTTIQLHDGARYVCSCKASGFRKQVTEDDTGNLFCKCGKIYTPADVAEISAPPEEPGDD